MSKASAAFAAGVARTKKITPPTTSRQLRQREVATGPRWQWIQWRKVSKKPGRCSVSPRKPYAAASCAESSRSRFLPNRSSMRSGPTEFSTCQMTREMLKVCAHWWIIFALADSAYRFDCAPRTRNGNHPKRLRVMSEAQSLFFNRVGGDLQPVSSWVLHRELLSASTKEMHGSTISRRGFSKNAARKNLSLIEKLYSIGLLARDMGDMTQAAISEAIGVNQPYISRGLAVVEYFERLQQDINLAEATARDIDSALKSYRTAPAQVDPLAGERETPALKEKIEAHRCHSVSARLAIPELPSRQTHAANVFFHCAVRRWIIQQSRKFWICSNRLTTGQGDDLSGKPHTGLLKIFFC